MRMTDGGATLFLESVLTVEPIRSSAELGVTIADTSPVMFRLDWSVFEEA